MLTDTQKAENKIAYLDLLLKLNIDLTAITKYLDSPRVDYFNKPYNAYQDYSYSGSLCEHSLILYNELFKLCNLYAHDKYSEEDLIKVALFKDLYRAELFEFYNKNVKNEVSGQWEQQMAVRNKEIRPVFGDIGFSSYMIAKKFIELDNDELVEAICFSSTNNMIDFHNIKLEYPLVILTAMAEQATNYLQNCR